LRLKNKEALKSYIERLMYNGGKADSFTDAELKDAKYIKSNKDKIIRTMTYRWMEEKVYEYLTEKEDSPYFEKVTAINVNDEYWLTNAIDKKEDVYLFDEAQIPAQFHEDLQNIKDYLYSSAVNYINKTLVKKSPLVSIDVLKQHPEHKTFVLTLSKANKWHEQIARKNAEHEMKADEKQALIKDTRFIADLGDGFTAVRLMTEGALDKESEYMRHCVGDGDYDKGVESGEIQIYSIRDKDGEPHATIEIKDNKILECKGKTNRAVVDKYMPYVRKFVIEQQFDLAHDFKNMGFCKDINGNVYNINDIPEGTVFDELDLSRMDFVELPEVLATCTVKKLYLTGCTYWNSFKNFPKGVEYLDCRYTGINSLKGCPAEALKKLDCSCTSIDSLEGCPKSVEDINCSSTRITSLKGCPENVTHIDCSGCRDLGTFEGCSKKIKNIICYGCEGVKSIPDYIFNKAIMGLSASKIAKGKLNWLIKNKSAASKAYLLRVIKGNTLKLNEK